ncbi:putative glycosylphosphatidylinositol anchor synthesis protein [Erysiphe necator]|uniref:Putative glycosylphosphatidylinositol anchor synthesis protein n=1 Tax=Uncinula necator TaxID=52586 RepID=A0A0B1NXH4_UNCNE|nr:putative glycosylphosphatidylinositol anchor synthesis protein [Erysiphe necator]
MAKGARASTRKSKKAKLRCEIFGPEVTARTARLSAKILEIAAQPKPARCTKEIEMEIEDSTKQGEDMEIDSEVLNASTRSKSSRNKIGKRRSYRKTAIVFPKYRKGKKYEKGEKQVN